MQLGLSWIPYYCYASKLQGVVLKGVLELRARLALTQLCGALGMQGSLQGGHGSDYGANAAQQPVME